MARLGRGINDLSILAQFNNRCWSVSLARRLNGNPAHLPSPPVPGPLSLHIKKLIYRVSVRSLFIFAILEETERSMVRSPISTTRPPMMSELT